MKWLENNTHTFFLDKKNFCYSIFKRAASKAFTLAEVLIVIGIIGIIATMVIPTLVSDVMGEVYQKAKTVAIKKITEATDQMKTNKVLTGYSTTDAFVDELQKYLKINQRCTSSNLTDCFANSFKNDGLSFNTSSLTAGSSIGPSTYSSQNVGLVLADGTLILLAFDPNCQEIPWWNNSTSTTSCIAMVYDVNGKKGPNEIGKDIGSLNTSFPVKVENLYVTPNDITFSPISEHPYTSNDNYWAGARVACENLGMELPTMAQLMIIYTNYDEYADTLGMHNGSSYWGIEQNGPSEAMRYTFPANATTDNNFNSQPASAFIPKLHSVYKARCIKN